MHYAAQAVCLPAMRLLLDAGVAIDSRTELGETPLQMVAARNAVDAVELLLPAGDALGTLEVCWHDLEKTTKAAVQKYVREICLTAACSIRGISMCVGGDGVAGPAMSTDVLHCILERVLGAGEKFVRLLLDGDWEGCAWHPSTLR